MKKTGYSHSQIRNMLQGTLLEGSKQEVINGRVTWLIPDKYVDILVERRTAWKAARYNGS